MWIIVESKKCTMNIKDIIEGMGLDTPVMVMDDYDEAVIGMTLDNRLIYSLDKIRQILMDVDGMTQEDAEDYISYNIVGSINPNDDRYPILAYDLNVFVGEE